MSVYSRDDPCGQYISLKGKSHLLREGKANLHPDEIFKAFIWLEGRGRWHIALLGFIFMVDLLDLASIDAQAPLGQERANQACAESLHDLLVMLGSENHLIINRLVDLKDGFGKAETIGVHPCLSRRLHHHGSHGIMGQNGGVDFLADSLRRLGT